MVADAGKGGHGHRDACVALQADLEFVKKGRGKRERGLGARRGWGPVTVVYEFGVRCVRLYAPPKGLV